jgi:hypothetical protein
MRTLIGLKQLVGKFPADQVDAACQLALSHDALRLRTIRQLLKRGSAKEEQAEFEFLEHHPVIRPLSDYSLESLQAFRKERHENITA